jgi:hypothetical protein
MSNTNGREDNDNPIIWGVSHLDGVTPVQVKFDPATRAMMIDTVTSIAFNPTTVPNTLMVPSNVKFATATSSADNTTIRPWVVNASTGAVLIET